MATTRINKKDTNGTKPLLGEGEFGYDKYPAGGDEGRVWVGTGSENIALAQKQELDDVVSGATAVTFDNTVSGLTATTLKGAVDELDGRLDTIEGFNTLAAYGITDAYTQTEIDGLLAGQNQAVEIAYDNAASGLTATNVKTAIDEVQANVELRRLVTDSYSQTEIDNKDTVVETNAVAFAIALG